MNNPQPNKLKMCSVNICGLSSRSQFVLNKYIESDCIDILKMQETGTADLTKLEIQNMSVISDRNNAVNKGTALYVSNKYSITNLESISKITKNIDSCWGLVTAHNKRYIIGNVYVKLNYSSAIKEVLKMLKAAQQKQTQLRAAGVIMTGDFNARHLSWGDSINNEYGRILSESLDNTLFSICTSKSPTFLCANGSSHIDLSIISNNLVESVIACYTDDEVELFSGAPARGHVPLIMELNIGQINDTTESKEKLDISKMHWEDWEQEIEHKINEDSSSLESEENPYTLWNKLNNIITEATNNHGETKKCCHHSKPYWTDSLTRSSKKLRAARKAYTKRNTDPNLVKLNEAKEAFDTERHSACRDFLINKAKQLNSVQCLHFWKEFNKIFKKKSVQKIDPLDDGNDGFFTNQNDMENCLFSTFFEGKHLINENFDSVFYTEVNNIYEGIMNEARTHENQNEVNDSQSLNRKITVKELLQAIKSNGKSVDNLNFHPNMFKHLGKNAINLLLKLFNLCLSKHQWVWECAEVIFLRKEGKESYSKPGSYRPICITAYIGKLFEKIIATRIEELLKRNNLTDPDQEGFSAGKNTIRYLNRLHLGIEADIENNLTVLCLFVDFEKAFDSVWKKGLIVKLHKFGIRGNLLNLIDHFLFSRKVQININGLLGNLRQCAEYGLPQGSVISPALFKIYVSDFLTELNQRQDIVIYKFADDGTVKVTAKNSPTCVQILEHILVCLQTWSKRWRMNINCNRNKTEVICFNTVENNRELIPTSFKLGENEIYRVNKTKVLGMTIDEDLSYIPHSQLVLRSLHEIWSSLCKYSNRHWGFTQLVMLQLIKTLFISKLSYASHVWTTKDNMKEINKLWYHILKSIIGAVLNISQDVAEIILGVPPLHIQVKVNSIKHFLKLNIKPVESDRYREFILETYNDLTKSPRTMHNKFKDIFLFLNWKMNISSSDFNTTDKEIVGDKMYSRFLNLSTKSCSYSKELMKKYTEHLWNKSVTTQFQLEGYQSSPNPKLDPQPIPPGTTRETEVLYFSMLYKNNILNGSLYKLGKVPSPMCSLCDQEEETPDHILFRCTSVDEDLRKSAIATYELANSEAAAEVDTYIGLLNASKNPEFLHACINILTSVNLRLSVEL